MLTSIWSSQSFLGAVVFQKIEEEREEEAHLAKISATEV